MTNFNEPLDVKPSRIFAPVTPNDAVDLPYLTRMIAVSGAGNLHVAQADGTERTITVAAGAMLPIVVSRVYATDTTATGITALF